MRTLIAALLAALPGLAAAQALPPSVTSVALIPGWSEADGTRVAALEIRLADGWHTYWRAPGMNGIPPQFDWSASGNLAAVGYDWPRPIVFETFGTRTIGYKDSLVLPLRLTPAQAEAPMDLALDLFFGVCQDICVPARAHVTARVAASDAPEGRARIEAALRAQPLAPEEAGVASVRCSLSAEAGVHQVTAEVTLLAVPGADTTAVIEAEARPDLWIGEAETRTEGRTIHATARLDSLSPEGPAVERSALRLTLLDPARAIDIRGCAKG